MGTWGATEAKAKFSAILTKVKNDGPQRVRRRDEEYIIATRVQFEKATKLEDAVDGEGKTSGERQWDRLRCPPSERGDDVELVRPHWTMRKVKF